MDPGEVEAYVERSEQLIEASPQMDEQNTKVRLVQPFLELLGWDLYSTEVELEYAIRMASGQTHVDYVLLVGDSPAVFVEAKPVRSVLTDQDISQLKSYMRQALDVDWGILTNGKSFEVLTKSGRGNSGEEVAVASFDLEDLAENPAILDLLTKESIRSGRSDEIAAQVAKTNETIRQLQDNEQAVAGAIRNAVEEQVGEVPIDLEEQATEFVNNLVQVLREQRQFVSESTRDDSTSEQEDDNEPPSIIGSTDGPDNPTDLEPKANKIAGTISRSELEGPDSARVAVFPTRESGLPFLVENNAWGFVRVGSQFDYVAMYVTDEIREVRYVARVSRVVDNDVADLQREPLDYKDRAKIAEDKKVIEFQEGSLYELEDPIPYQNKYPQSLRYTTLGALKSAETTDDLF